MTVATAAAALSLGGATASHASDQLEVRYAGSVPDDCGTLEISARSGADIQKITAHLTLYATQSEVAEVRFKDLRLVSGTPQDGVWRTKKPLKLATIGSYRVDVDATDADGDHVRRQSAGDLSYFVVPQFGALSVDRSSIDREHRDVEVKGTLYGRWPTREVKPLSARKVDIEVDYWPQVTVSTDAHGRFRTSVRLDNAAQIQAVFRMDGGTPTVLYGKSEPVQIGVEQVPTRFTATVDKTDIDYGQSVKLNVAVEQKTADGWVPLAGKSGGVLFGADDYQTEEVGGFTTAEDGTFTVDYAPWQAGYFQLALNTNGDPFLQASTGTSTIVRVHKASKFTAFTAGRSGTGQVHTEGLVDFPDGSSPSTVLVDIQYSPDGTEWTTVATDEALWEGRGYAFAADIERSTGGFYRAVFAGSDVFQTATSQSMYVGASV
ncbi:hypothetical protein [Streptomyces sp. H39-S7]|uniref:hypothetical protein n=1 Tax=Streptomyces sp. H39-S7 TaxID=3004357 RepID=UPI0022AEB111|nr:hypothetical protein [Streptomyces sp. H39-S7]MCZ4122445.1 hypothetical protein [Streptomyces sp. H39-S7]